MKRMIVVWERWVWSQVSLNHKYKRCSRLWNILLFPPICWNLISYSHRALTIIRRHIKISSSICVILGHRKSGWMGEEPSVTTLVLRPETINTVCSIHPIWNSSYSRPISVSWWILHIRLVLFHTLHRGQRDTIICTYLINCATLYLLPFPHLRESSVLTPLIYSSSPSYSASAAASAAASVVSYAPVRSITTCSRHCIPTCAPCCLSSASHRSRSDFVAIYWATIFCFRQMHVSIVSNPAFDISASTEVYSHFPSSLYIRIRPVSRRTTWSWKNPRTCPMRGRPHLDFITGFII